MPKKIKKSNKKKQEHGLSVPKPMLMVVLLAMVGVALIIPATRANSENQASTDRGSNSNVTQLTAPELTKNSADSKPAPDQTPQDPPAVAGNKPPQPAPLVHVAQKPPETPVAQPTPVTPVITPQITSSLSFINNVRAGVGKPALQQNTAMDQWALSHATQLASSCSLYHQTLGQFLGVNIGPVTTSSVAENVGYANTIPAVLDGLKNSPGHYANMIGDYSFAGIGVVTAGPGSCQGYIYTAQMFAK